MVATRRTVSQARSKQAISDEEELKPDPKFSTSSASKTKDSLSLSLLVSKYTGWIGWLAFLVTFFLFFLRNDKNDEEVDSLHAAFLRQGRDMQFQQEREQAVAKSASFGIINDQFVVAGVNLASFKEDGDHSLSSGAVKTNAGEQPFELFEDFDIGDKIKGTEEWLRLIGYREELQKQSHIFYADKVARKRWLSSPLPNSESGGGQFDQPKSYVLLYSTELTVTGKPEDEFRALTSGLLPQKMDYVAKPSHRFDDGIRIVTYDSRSDTGRFGKNGQMLEVGKDFNYDEEITNTLVKYLNAKPNQEASWSQQQVFPGVVVEERFRSPEKDDMEAVEFKCITIWGRLWLAKWRHGYNQNGLVDRQGHIVKTWSLKSHESIPDWVDWERVVEIAERLGANKDMIRTDVFVGVGSSSSPDQIRYVVSESEIQPKLESFDPTMREEAARLWKAGYKMGNYKTVTNREVPEYFVQNKKLDAPPYYTKKWVKSEHTLPNFNVAGVNLALYNGADSVKEPPLERRQIINPETAAAPFELFEDFNIADQITGNEGWIDLIRYRQKLQRPSLSFYLDKVVQNRWFKANGLPHPKGFVVKYASELTSDGNVAEEMKEVLKLLPPEVDYAAKPSHMASIDGVWLVSRRDGARAFHVGQFGRDLTVIPDFDPREIARSIVGNLHNSAIPTDSWALRNVRPGFVIEERFTSIKSDERPLLECETFTIWGKVWAASCRSEDGSIGMVDRDGTIVEGREHKENKKLPEWIDWKRVVDFAEQMGAHKDMHRTDIFVGIPAGHDVLQNGYSEEERLKKMEYVVSEFGIHPITSIDPLLLDEAARLWISGYKMGNYKLVPNTEVPQSFLEVSGPMENGPSN